MIGFGHRTNGHRAAVAIAQAQQARPPATWITRHGHFTCVALCWGLGFEGDTAVSAAGCQKMDTLFVHILVHSRPALSRCRSERCRRCDPRSGPSARCCLRSGFVTVARASLRSPSWLHLHAAFRILSIYFVISCTVAAAAAAAVAEK